MKRFVLFIATMFALSGAVSAQTQLTVTHGPVPTPTYVDVGTPGESVGDQRIWQFDAQSSDQESVVTDWIMTTTGQGRVTPDMESRVTLGIFSFGKGAKDTILIQGVGLYPMTGSTLKSDSVLQRAVIGGTGKYAGASGTVTSTRSVDDTWQHVFNLK
jgi:hypothetical protein